MQTLLSRQMVLKEEGRIQIPEDSMSFTSPNISPSDSYCSEPGSTINKIDFEF